MSGPNDVQRKWLLDLLSMLAGAGAASKPSSDSDPADGEARPGGAGAPGGGSGLPAQAWRSADSGQAHPRIIRVTDKDLPPVKDLDLPSVDDNLVDITDSKTKLVEKMLWSELQQSAHYADNGIQSLSALPGDIANLTVRKMTLMYTGGRKLDVAMETVKLKGANARATAFQRQQGFVVPLDGEGEIAFDRNNTPNVIVCAQWINDEIARRKQTRQEIAEIVSTFAGAVAGLATAASQGSGVTHPEVSGGLPRRGGNRTGGAKAGQGGAAGEPEGGGAGGRPKGPARNTGTADTVPAPARPPARGRPLDETPLAPGVKKGPATVDTDSPKGGSGGSGHKAGEVLRGRPVEPVPRLPDNQRITIKTSSGPAEMSVGEYRKRWQSARQWLGQENSRLDQRRGTPPTPELIKKAQDKFGLDDHWQWLSNPFIYGKL
jgi:hypothetical protein